MAAPLLRQASGAGTGLQGYRLGVVLGLLPCGFLYAALVAAAATGSALAGALAMASFALGTVPGLVALGVLGGAALRRWRGLANAIATPVFLLNAFTLGGLAVRMVA
jgi:sulfite exporter TauE/SafE